VDWGGMKQQQQTISEPEFVNVGRAQESIPPAYVARIRICKRLKSPGIDTQPGAQAQQPSLTYRPARLYIHRLAKLLGFLKPRNTAWLNCH
jgi:hypothetical protein